MERPATVGDTDIKTTITHHGESDYCTVKGNMESIEGLCLVAALLGSEDRTEKTYLRSSKMFRYRCDGSDGTQSQWKRQKSLYCAPM
jgi:hypothetical protein